MGIKFLLLLCGLGISCAPAFSQTTFATITGTVVDATGAVIPKAKITATHTETNIAASTLSNDAGVYTIPQLKEGRYEVRAVAPGFREYVVQDVVLAARDLRRIDLALEVGAVGTAVEVFAGATLIETETARISDTRESRILNMLPLNDRAIWPLLDLSPGVVQQPGSSVYRFSGSRSNQVQWAIDGTSFSDNVDGTQIGPLANYVESFQEVKLDIANNTAEFGSLGQVTIISKSGTNDVHGSLFDYYSTPWFRARDTFAEERSSGISHRPGGSLGGPVVLPKIYNGRNKTFFFFSFETARGSVRSQRFNPTVPPVPWRSGDFSGLSAVIYDPQSGVPFPNNRIPADRINATAKKIQERFYPLPNFGNPNVLTGQSYRELRTRPYDPNTYAVWRGDHRISEKDLIYGRFTFQRLYNNVFEGNLPTIGQRYQERNTRAGTASWTHTFRPTIVNEVRWGMSLNNNPIVSPVNGPAIVKELGIEGLAPNLPDYSGLVKVNWTGLGLQRIAQTDYSNPGSRQHSEDFQETFSWFRNRHNLKFGANLRRAEWDALRAPANLYGTLTFSTRYTSNGVRNMGSPYADFLLGLPSSSARAFPPVLIERNRWMYDFYALDDFKVSPLLTLSLGLRYEYHQPWRENHNLTSLFDIASGKIVIENGASSKVSPLMPKTYVDVVEASAAGLPGRTLIRPDRNNFAPRIGAAFRPWGNHTVFRAGWGLYYDVVPLNPNQGGIPFVINEPSFNNPARTPVVVLPRIFPAEGVRGPSDVGLPAAVNPDVKIPYSMQYNFTIERQQWNTGFRISYIGTAGRHGIWAYNINSPVPDTRLYIDKPRAFPRYPGIDYYTNGAGHQYNGLSAEVQRHMAHGLYFQSSWTWARDRYDMDYNGDLDSSEFTPENPFNRKRDVGPAPGIPTHRFTSNVVYQLPFGKGRPWLGSVSRPVNLLVGGWEVSAVFSATSGQFLTPLWTGPDPTGTAFTDSDTPADVTRRPDYLRNANLPAGQRTLTRWFDPSAFAAPQAGAFGSAGRGVVIGPGVNVWHVGFHKDFLFQEHGPRLRWEMTATNFFNHPNYANPGLDITDPTNVGVITASGGWNADDNGGSRSFRMGIRLEW